MVSSCWCNRICLLKKIPRGIKTTTLFYIIDILSKKRHAGILNGCGQYYVVIVFQWSNIAVICIKSSIMANKNNYWFIRHPYIFKCLCEKIQFWFIRSNNIVKTSQSRIWQLRICIDDLIICITEWHACNVKWCRNKQNGMRTLFSNIFNMYCLYQETKIDNILWINVERSWLQGNLVFVFFKTTIVVLQDWHRIWLIIKW